MSVISFKLRGVFIDGWFDTAGTQTLQIATIRSENTYSASLDSRQTRDMVLSWSIRDLVDMPHILYRSSRHLFLPDHDPDGGRWGPTILLAVCFACCVSVVSSCSDAAVPCKDGSSSVSRRWSNSTKAAIGFAIGRRRRINTIAASYVMCSHL